MSEAKHITKQLDNKKKEVDIMNENKINTIVEAIKEIVPSNMEVKVMEVCKNNVVLHGLTITDISKETQVSPTIYLENYETETDYDKIAYDIVSTYYNAMEQANEFNYVQELIKDFDSVKDMLRIRLINKENNTKLFESVPYMPFLDMAIIAVIELENTENGIASVKVTHQLLQLWGYNSLSDILPIANENTFAVKYNLQSMASVLAEISGESVEEFEKEFADSRSPMMYILTNENKLNGATEICKYSTMEEIAEQLKSDLFVLPSSINECIIVPKDDGTSVEEMTQMVQEVNGTQVPLDEVLSDHAYVFTRENGWSN